MENVPVVILCGGKGTRLREQTEAIPKPMVEIGGMPILWHIMKSYAHCGFKEFVLCLGYKSEKIKDFFVNFRQRTKSDFVLSSGVPRPVAAQSKSDASDWTITFAETGAETNTGGRIKQIEKYVKTPTFFATYGDGLSDIDFVRQLEHHRKHGRAATMTCVRPKSQFGIVELDRRNRVTQYHEKPQMEQWVNGGFFVLDRGVFARIGKNEVFEQQPLRRLRDKKELVAYPFSGFWACMDTYKDAQNLNDLWSSGRAPWKRWKDSL